MLLMKKRQRKQQREWLFLRKQTINNSFFLIEFMLKCWMVESVQSIPFPSYNFRFMGDSRFVSLYDIFVRPFVSVEQWVKGNTICYFSIFTAFDMASWFLGSRWAFLFNLHEKLINLRLTNGVSWIIRFNIHFHFRQNYVFLMKHVFFSFCARTFYSKSCQFTFKLTQRKDMQAGWYIHWLLKWETREKETKYLAGLYLRCFGYVSLLYWSTDGAYRWIR